MKKIIITSGGTSERIDNVRKITNSSSGKLGMTIANHLLEGNNDIMIYYVCSKNSLRPTDKRVKVVEIDGTIDLKNRSHVGGISYDEKHNLVFICDTNGRVSSYSYNSFEKKNSYEVASIKGEKLLEKNKLVCSYLTCYNNKLYVGSFNLRNNGFVKVFDITREEDGIKLNFLYDIKVPKKTQGLTFYEHNNKTYLFISRSYGRRNSSKLNIYNYDDNKREYLSRDKIITLPPMLEQITTLNKELVLLFESNAFKYRNTCKYVIENLVSLDIIKLIG